MLVKGIYINGLACISAQPTIDSGLESFQAPTTSWFECIEPDYKSQFSSIALRRLSRILKISLFTAQRSLQDACLMSPDAIITGTGLGCLEDTEKFLKSIIDYKEEFLSPTAFMLSTHNTISGQIAIMLKCNKANNTFSNRYFSFESSLLESLLMLKEGDASNVLVGSADEMTPFVRDITQKINLWTSNGVSVAGEGAMYAVVSDILNDQTYAEICAFEMLYQPSDDQNIEVYIQDFITDSGYKLSDIDLIISGESNETKKDYSWIAETFKHAGIINYKPYIGEYFTASSFAYYMAGQILKTGKIPVHYITKNPTSNQIKKVLIYNQFKGEYHSLALLSHV